MSGKRHKNVSLSARLPRRLVEQVDQLARERGLSRSELIEKGLNLLVQQELLTERECLRLATEAMREHRPSPLRVDWATLEKRIRQSKPKLKTIEEAMAQARKRR